jgi:non-ribosomal peptide synthetase component E (peptide arylation enzyme)
LKFIRRRTINIQYLSASGGFNRKYSIILGIRKKELTMVSDGFIPNDSNAAELYNKKRWWLGMTMGDMLDKTCDLYPSKEALVGSGKRYTYAQLRRQVDIMAYNLILNGLKPGDLALLQLPNLPEFVISYFAMQKIGVVTVLLTVNHTAREIGHLAGLTHPKAWIVTDQYRHMNFLNLVENVRKNCTSLDQIILVGKQKLKDSLHFDDLLHSRAVPEEIKTALEKAHPQPQDVCQILPTGGTTGLPKGASRTHNDYLCNVEYASKAWDINVNDTCLVATTVGYNLALLITGSGGKGYLHWACTDLDQPDRQIRQIVGI